MANIKLHDASENERFLGWSWEVFETLSNGGVNVIDDGDCRFHFLVDIPSDFPGQFTGQPETLLTDKRFKHGTERTISNRYYTSYRYLSAWHIRNGTKANQGSFNRFYNNIFRWKSSQTSDINDFGAWVNFAEDNSLADTALPAGYPGFETAVVYEQGNGTLGLPYNMGADAGSYNNLDHDYPPYKYHCDASNLTDVHDIAKYLDRTNTETAATVMTNANLPTDMFNLAWTLDGSTGKPSASADAESWIRSRLQIEQYDITYKTYWGLPTVEDQGEVTWIIKNVTPQHLYDPTHIGTYPGPYLYAYILTPTKIRPVKLGPSAYNRGASLAYNYPSTSLSPGGIHFFDNNDEVLFGEKVPWCGGTSSGGTSSDYRVTVNFANCDHWHWSLNGGAESRVMTGNTADITAVDGTNTLVVKGVDASHAQLATDTHTFANIITTNLDLPDEPEPDEFVAASSNYSWRTYRTAQAIKGYGAGRNHWRYMQVRWAADASEPNFTALGGGSKARCYVWIPEFAIELDYFDAIGSNSGADVNSNVYSNRRYLHQNGMDLLFPFGIYKPMNPAPINAIYASAQSDFAGNLTMRDGDISNYINNVIPVIKHDGTTATNPTDPQYITVSKVTDPPAYDDAQYSMTFDGFDLDLWEFSTTMAPGFTYKNESAELEGYNFLDYDLWSSRLFAKEGVYDEGSDISNFKLADNPRFMLDGYMYYRGNQSEYSSDAGLIGDAVFDGDPAANTTSFSALRFSYDIARKPLSSDHTMQTVADALKERRSNRTVTKIPARPAISSSFLIDGEVKKFQSGEWYYPSNSPMSGTNFSSITASTPYSVEGKQFQNEYYFAKDFTITST